MKLTQQQCTILTGYTGVLIGSFSDFQQDAEKRLGRTLLTHEMASAEVMSELKELYKKDFLALIPE
ncbi:MULTISPECIES: hypothetical protein [unclassified Enterobacter]|uniref:DUF7736 domain-containing protein n=1 Tax=unclassified Enterobacter TaxID=2608935 RepID=UPI0025904C5B|nr:hypothetical protein [Enterobacter sp.]EKS6643999.1 hypothetical protein [Enterobacter hormaechei]MBS6390543.1 hypothetical protein [Enterobacter sp.]